MIFINNLNSIFKPDRRNIRVRFPHKEISYGNDYAEMVKLKEFADKNKISVILVHHLRKQNDSDMLNMMSGTNGLSGAADTILILSKSKRNINNATLYYIGRDIEERKLELQFDKKECIWKLIFDSIEEPEKTFPAELQDVIAMMKEKKSFNGFFSEYVLEYNTYSGKTLQANILSRLMNKYRNELEQSGVYFKSEINRDGRKICVDYVDCVD